MIARPVITAVALYAQLARMPTSSDLARGAWHHPLRSRSHHPFRLVAHGALIHLRVHPSLTVGQLS